MNPLLALVPDFITEHLNWILAGAIVVVGLFIVGMKDLSRLSMTRAWAISSVSFAESIRRRVLWITPLAIVGIIIVSQLQRPFDEADAIRQTIKICLFATATVVVIVTLILACTNLPKEIDNRVIYTVVTKPTTRLEIVIGKVIGFARVSATILIIMGIFTWGYLEFRAWNLQRDIAQRLASGDVAASNRPTMEHYRDVGLLSAKSYEWPEDLNVYAVAPLPTDQMRWVYGKSEQTVLVPFSIAAEDLVPDGGQSVAQGSGVDVVLHLAYRQRNLTTQEVAESGGPQVDIENPSEAPTMGPLAPGVAPRNENRTNAPAPRVVIEILNQNQNALIASDKINNWSSVVVPRDVNEPVRFHIPPEQVAVLQRSPKFYVMITPMTVATQYGVRIATKPEESPVELQVMGVTPGTGHRLFPMDPGTGKVATPIFRGRIGTYGQQLKGGPAESSPVAVYGFRNAQMNGSDTVRFEFRAGIERSGEDTENEDMTNLEVSVRDAEGKPAGAPIVLIPENNRMVYFQLPAADLNGGNFDVLLRNRTQNHWIGLRHDTLAMIVKDHSFAYNLTKSLTIMWMLSMLVTIVSVFASTFVSWPIAIVLTLVILLGRWGVEQLGDALEPGIGRRVVTDIFGGSNQNAPQARVVSTTVEALSKYLSTLASVLPDISQFQSSEDVERGISIPPARLQEALVVLVGFGLPLGVLAYVFLKFKEVAP